jgi:hypothetical protein
MSPAEEFRAALRNHLGAEAFSEFLRVGTRPRLRFWQEKALEKFFAEHPEQLLPIAEVEAALRFCEVHLQELELGSVPIVRAHITYAAQKLVEKRMRSPYAGVDPLSRPDAPPGVESEPFWFCQECRSIAVQRRNGEA